MCRVGGWSVSKNRKWPCIPRPPLNDVGRAVLRDQLYTAGELLRMGQLEPDPKLANVPPKQIELFGPES